MCAWRLRARARAWKCGSLSRSGYLVAMPEHDRGAFSRRRMLALAGAAGGLACAAQNRERKGTVMNVIPNSPSIVLRATHILLIRIEAAQIGEWTSPPDKWIERRARLTVALEETLKGNTREKPGEQVAATVTQFRNPSDWEIAVPG